MKLRFVLMCSLFVFAVAAIGLHSSENKMEWKGDEHFAQKVTMHHQMGVQMTEMCQQKAKHDELKDLCKKMTDDQKRDNERIAAMPGLSVNREAAAADSSKTASDKMEHGKMHKMDAEMRKMHEEGMSMHQRLNKASGDDFDAAFLQNMSKHHKEAIKMSGMCESNAKNADLRQLCTEMKTNQEKDRTQMQSWLTEWYPKQAKAKGSTADHKH